jgi:hypothetical protein
MVFHVFFDDHIEPHVEVMVKGTKFRFSLLNGKPLPGKAKAPAKVRKQVQGWLETEMPSLRRTVRAMMHHFVQLYRRRWMIPVPLSRMQR